MFDAVALPRSVHDLVGPLLAGLRPPERISLSDFAAKHVWVNNPSTAGRQRLDFAKTPYQVEILDALSDPDVQGVRFVAPSRAGKTYLSILLAAHTVETNPMDILIVPPSRSTATTFAKDDLEKFLDENDWLRNKIRPGRTTNSLLMKKFINGTILSIVWPSAKNLAGVNRGVICLPDYDRIKADVDGEGSVYNQADARTKIYGRRKKVFVESSPSKNPVKFEKFEPETPHQAPPYPGILSLYNEGDRRCWYWQCVCCRQWFQAHPDYLKYDDDGDPKQRAASVRLVCPNDECGTEYQHDGKNGLPGKHELNANGRWVPDGQSLDDDGNLVGEMASPPVPGLMNYRSYWLTGVAAAFQSWESMVLAKINAEQVFAKTGDDSQLKTVINTDFGLPWIPPHVGETGQWERYWERAVDYPQGVIPDGALYCVTTVDTQKTSWVLQTQAFGPEGRMWCVDRRRVIHSDRDHETRLTADGTPEKAWVRPGTYPEDWKVLERELASLRYSTADGTGVMVPALIGVDSGGEDATTANAYAWWRSINTDGLTRSRVLLIKGDPKAKNLAEIRKPDGTKRTDRNAGGRGDVPVLFVSSNMAKDVLAANLAREVDGPGFVHLPAWWKVDYFKELAAEQKRGDEWVKVRRRNEAWDLFVYALALNRCEKMKAHLVDWENPDRIPSYALPWDRNPFVSPVKINTDGTVTAQPSPASASPYLSYEQIGQQFRELDGGFSDYP